MLIYDIVEYKLWHFGIVVTWKSLLTFLLVSVENERKLFPDIFGFGLYDFAEMPEKMRSLLSFYQSEFFWLFVVRSFFSFAFRVDHFFRIPKFFFSSSRI